MKIDVTDVDAFVISDAGSVNLITEYIQKFSDTNRTGRFFRYFENGVGTKKVIGRQALGSFAQTIAVVLDLSNVFLK